MLENLIISLKLFKHWSSMDLNQSSYVQHTSEDDSVDYSVNWDTFSFKSELETRNNTIKQCLHDFKLFAKFIAADISEEVIIPNSQENWNTYCELVKENEIISSKYDILSNEHKNLEEIFDNLTLRNTSLENDIKAYEEEESALRKEYQLHKGALQKGLKMYTAYFDLHVDVKNISDVIYEATIQFEKANPCNLTSPLVIFRVDRTRRKVIEFDMGEGLDSTKGEDISKRFGDLHNLLGLLCALHDLESDLFVARNTENV